MYIGLLGYNAVLNDPWENSIRPILSLWRLPSWSYSMPIFSTLLILLFSSRILPYCPDYDFSAFLYVFRFSLQCSFSFNYSFWLIFLFPDQFTVRVSLLASGHSPSSIWRCFFCSSSLNSKLTFALYKFCQCFPQCRRCHPGGRLRCVLAE